MIVREANENDIPTITSLAEKIWWKVYPSIISREQIQYMLDTLYNRQALHEGLTSGKQMFLLLEVDGDVRAFGAFGIREEDEHVAKLYKLYVLREDHGKGYGKALIEAIKNRLAFQNVRTLELNVNRHNPAISFYNRMGFQIIREEDMPIGPYWMNDFVMQLRF